MRKYIYHKPDVGLVVASGLLFLFGLIMLSSASSVVAFQKFGDSYFYFKEQFVHFLIGLPILIFFAALDYKIWRKYASWFLFGSIVLLILVFVPGLGFQYGAAKSWINLGFTTLQPAEFVKLAFIIYLAAWLEKRGEGIKDLRYGVAPFLIVFGLITALIALQPDIGTMSIIVMIGLGMFFVAGARWQHILALIGSGFVFLYFLINFADYRADRLKVFLNPTLDPQGIGYHINQALLAVGSGGFWGLGLGRSRQKYNFLPEVSGDSIFAIIAEELGFLFSVLLIVLFAVLIYRGLKIGQHAPDNFGKYLAAGIVVWLAGQAFVNIGAMLGLLPLTGIPLPFISFGGSALVVTMAAIGILINISRQTKVKI